MQKNLPTPATETGIKSVQTGEQKFNEFWAGLPAQVRAEVLPIWKSLNEFNRFDREKAMLSVVCAEPENIKKLHFLTISAVLSAKSISLASLKRYRGAVVKNAVLHELIYRGAEMFNVGKGLTDAAIEELAHLISSEYYFLTIAEIRFVFQQAALGKFGKTYDRFDGATVLEMFAKYVDESRELAAEIQRHNYNQKQKDIQPNWEKFDELFAPILAKGKEAESLEFLDAAISEWIENEKPPITAEKVKQIILEHHQSERKGIPLKTFAVNKFEQLKAIYKKSKTYNEKSD